MKSREIIPAGSWMHLAAVYNQSYGLKFDGRTGYLDCGKETTLDISTDLTIQVGVKVEGAGSMGILSRGRLDGQDINQNVPYALFLTSDHKVGFAFQDIDHAVHYCVSNGTVGNAYTEIGVTRERKQAPSPKSEGHPEKIDAWDEISFYINGRRDSTAKYENSNKRTDYDSVLQPVDVGSNSDPLEVGLGFQSKGEEFDEDGLTHKIIKIKDPLTPARFVGVISELSIWNKARTSTEIADPSPFTW